MSATPDHPETEPAPVVEDAASVTAEHVVPNVHDTLQQADHHATAADLHVAPSEPHPLKLNLWQRWLAWSGSFFVLSLLVHVLLIGVATLLVVQVVAGRKEKLKFTAPPPSAAGPKTVEHKVKPPKSTVSAPSVSKRIISQAPSATIALPPMAMSPNSAPDVMADVMSGLGKSTLGVGGAPGAGPAGAASMPSGGLTAFGYKGGGGAPGLKVNLYDLKQTRNGSKTDIGEDFDKGAVAEALCDYKCIRDAIAFMEGKWEQKLLDNKYYKAKDTITAYDFDIAYTGGNGITQAEVLKAFGADTSVKPGYLIIHYTGKVTAPKSTEYEFRHPAGFFAIRWNNDNYFCEAAPETVKSLYPNGTHDRSFKTSAGVTYPIDMLVLIGNPRKNYKQLLRIIDKNRKDYPKNDFIENNMGPIRYPLFRVKAGLPFPEYIPPDWSKKPPGAGANWAPSEPKGPKFDEEIVFPAQK